MKRNIKFNDDRMDLVLDFCLDPDGGAPWRKLHPEQAKETKRRMGGGLPAAEVIGRDELDDLLGCSDAGGGNGSNTS